jgi:hypothetical protein
MSMDVCYHCDAYIDTDDDPDCYVEVGNMRRLHKTICLCERCRDDRIEELELNSNTGD